MRVPLMLAASALAWLAAAAPARAEARVTFVNPEAFTDANLYGSSRPVTPDSPALVALRRVFERLSRRLPAGQVLQVEVFDIDLAGYYQPWRILEPNLRVLTPATWPRINLRYAVVTQDGRVVASGEDTITDMTYLRRPSAVRSLDPLRFEEPMLQDWFDERFGGSRQAMAR